MDYNPTAFISYSWDSEEHKRWVLNLTNKLRENGIDATNDVFITQKGTTNLNTMMIENIKNNDYTIIVLTEKYAEKADKLEGGVGYETTLLSNYINENEEKIIPIMKSNKGENKSIPFYLKGLEYINFSKDEDFEEKFRELLYRIYKEDLFKQSPIGTKPNLSPIDTSLEFAKTSEDDLIPSFSSVNDISKNQFMKESFEYITDGLENLMNKTKQKNEQFDYEREDITSRKTLYKLYLDGNIKTTTKIWLGNTFGTKVENINLSYDGYSVSNDSSMNEIIACEVDESNNLKLKMTMNIFSDKKIGTKDEILKNIWEDMIRRIK